MKDISIRVFSFFFFFMAHSTGFSQSGGTCAFTSNVLKIRPVAVPIVSISGTSPIKLGKSTKLVAHKHTTGKTTFLWSTGDTATVIKVKPNLTTVYTVTATNPAGCTATAQFAVQVAPGQSSGKILDFTAYRKGMASKLDWVSNTGGQNDYFIVERSADSLNFVPMLKITGRGEANIDLFFTENDNHPFDGNNFYRLILVNRDGSQVFSQVKKVVFPRLSELSVFPNPTSDKFFVNLGPFEGEQVSVQLINVDSRLIEKYEVRASRSLFEIETAGLPSGMYFLRIGPAGKRARVLKVVVARK